MRKLFTGVRPHISRRALLRHGLPTAVLMAVGTLVIVFAQVGGTPTSAQRDGSGYSGDCSPQTTATVFQGELAGMALGNSHRTTTVTKWKTATKTVTKTKTVTTTRTKPVCRTVTATGENKTVTVTSSGPGSTETTTLTAPGSTTTTTITAPGSTTVTTTTITVTEAPPETITTTSGTFN
jgi:hypothetical protein